MDKYMEILIKAKEENKFVPIQKFLKRCKEEGGFNEPVVLREIIKRGLYSVLK